MGEVASGFGDLIEAELGKKSSPYGILASYPPLPAPGRSILDTLGFMQVYRNPQDTLFFHSWPEEINEGLTTTWESLDFSGASGPLAFVYRGNHWDDYQVKLQMHTSNPQFPFRFRGAAGSPQFNLNSIIDLLRIQMQVAWCKSICLPNTDLINNAADKAVKSVLAAEDFGEALKAFGKAVVGQLEIGAAIFKVLTSKDGLYSGGLFPPVIATQYGGFLRLYGFCNSLQIRWLPPFTPLVAYPHRAEVTLNFQRFFPIKKTPTRTDARLRFGFMK